MTEIRHPGSDSAFSTGLYHAPGTLYHR